MPKICGCSGCRCQFISTKRDTLRKVKEFRARSQVTFSNSPRAITVLPTRASHPFQYVRDGSGMDVRALTTLDASSTRRF